MSASGKWSDGSPIVGEWRKGTFAAAGAGAGAAGNAALKGVARFNGRWAGQVCNQFRDRPEHCWSLNLVAKDGVLEARWLTPNKESSRASGTVGPDGAVTITLHSFSGRGEATQATLTGRVKDGRMEANGEWRGGVVARGSWTRPS